MKTPREIIGELLQAVEENNLDWDVNINNNIVTAVFESPITKAKTLNYMIIYNFSKLDNTKLIVDISYKTSGYIKTLPLISMGGENDPIIAKEVTYLLEKIMSAGGYNDDNEIILKGDRVVVIEKQNFEGDEIGQKGIVCEVEEKYGVCYCMVSFDIRFNSRLFSYKSKMKKQNCWEFRLDKLKKLQKEKWTY
jgi:hypothetical protein